MSSWSDPGKGRRLLTLLLAILAFGGSVRAETIVLGSVVDAATGGPLAGASVSIRQGNQVVGSVLSNGDGRFRLPFDVGASAAARHLTLSVEHPAYVGGSKTVVVASGRADSPSYRFDLLPKPLAPCRRNRDHAVVVGYFRPPASGGGADFAERIAEALSYDLLTQIQRAGLAQEEQPFVLACGAAKPQAWSDYGTFAKALGADAFLSGYVVPSGSLFKVEMSVAGRFDLLTPPARISSLDVNLDDPAAARLDRAAHTAILTALVTGYQQAGKSAECVQVTAAAERMLGTLPPALAAVRAKCRSALPNRGLLP